MDNINIGILNMRAFSPLMQIIVTCKSLGSRLPIIVNIIREDKIAVTVIETVNSNEPIKCPSSSEQAFPECKPTATRLYVAIDALLPR